MQRIAVYLIVLSNLIIGSCGPRPTISPTPDPATLEKQQFNDAERLFEAGSYDKALNAYTSFINLYPASEMADTALMKTGTILSALGRPDEAIEAYTRLLRRHPDSVYVPDARMAMMNLQLKTGQYQAVISGEQELLATVTNTPQRVIILESIGDAYLALQSPEDATYYYVQAHHESQKDESDPLLDKVRTAIQELSPGELQSVMNRLGDPASRNLLTALSEEFMYNRDTIGCLLPLSGPYELYGNKALRGIELALQEFGESDLSLYAKIVVKDTASDSETTRQAIRQLIDEHRVAAIIGPFIEAETAAMEAQEGKTPIITLTQKDGITDMGDFVFRNFFTPKMQVRALVSYAVDRLAMDRFAVLYPDERYGVTFMNLFWDEVIAHQATVTAVEAYPPGQTDFVDPIKKLVGLFYDVPGDLKAFEPMPKQEPWMTMPRQMGEQPDDEAEEIDEPQPIVDFDALFIPDSPKKAGLIVPQLAYHDVSDVLLLGTNLWNSRKMIDMSRPYIQRALVPEGFFAESTTPAVRRFVAEFNAIFEESPGFMEAIAFDSAMIILQAMSSGDNRTRYAIRDNLLATRDYPGVTGRTSFDASGDVLKELYLLKVDGDRFTEIDYTD